MTKPLRPLEQALESVQAAWVDALPTFDGVNRDAQVEIEQMSDTGVIAVTHAITQLRRDADVLLAKLAAEVAQRSSPEFGADGLAKQQGFHNSVRLLAASTGGTTGEAAKLIAVGTSTRSRSSLTGERLPSKHPAVADALERGDISVDAAAVITGMLDKVWSRVDPGQAGRCESGLVQFAAHNGLELVIRQVKLAVPQLDRDGVERRDDELRQERSLTIREDRHGMIHLSARLDPATAAPVKAALEAIVTDALHRARGDDTHPSHFGAVVSDTRTIPQIQADALADLARHCLGCTDAPAPVVKTTVVVRMDLDALKTGLGLAEIDGIDQPICAGTARRMAADAELIPVVLGRRSVPLDLGRGARLFTRAQRIALAERDGGCASCGQNIGYVEAHHIDWWERDAGPTNVSNGVMLCSFCHHAMHREGWQINATPNEVWFIPPPHVDPDQRPRLGGRARFELGSTRAA
ncbi:DUF222 domain-containing protein [Agromyces sp. NPDC058484]|uniref:HNH endonuclease signature motif containing protein n=1 Tax=Agromyces sp. NPDC058484 TaxID=3346524 RepID=UPI00365B6F1D